MSIKVNEKATSRKGNSTRDTYEYIIEGTSDLNAAKLALRNSTPTLRDGKPRADWDVEELCENMFVGRVYYSAKSSGYDSQSSTSARPMSFTTIGTQRNITSSIRTLASYAAPGKVAPDFENAINVDPQSKSVKGCDIASSVLEFVEPHYFDEEDITWDFILTLRDASCHVNRYQFRAFPPLEVLFLGASGQPDQDGKWRLEYKFAVCSNVIEGVTDTISVGQITGIEKFGWNYMWVLYEESNDSIAKYTPTRPIAVYIEKVYPWANFDVLRIGR